MFKHLSGVVAAVVLLAGCSGDTLISFTDWGTDGVFMDATLDMTNDAQGDGELGLAPDQGDSSVADSGSDGSACPDGWQVMKSTTTKDLHAVWGSGAKNIFAAGAGGTLLVHQGMSWSQVPVAKGKSGVTFRDVWGTASNNVFIIGSYDFSGAQRKGLILHWNGTKWSETDLGGSASMGLRAMHGLSSNSILAVGNEVAGSAGSGNYNHIVATFNGSVWSTATVSKVPGPSQLLDIWSSSSSTLALGGQCASGKCNEVFYRHDGTAWSLKTLTVKPPPGVMNGLWGSSASDIWAVGKWSLPGAAGQNWAVVTRFNGTSWVSTYLDKGYGLNGIWGASSSSIFAVGGKGRILNYSSGNWALMKSGTTKALSGVWGSSAKDVYAVGAGGTILHLCVP